jgi:branched-chain amino acid aminotransferase
MAFLFYFHSMNSICLNGKIVPGNEPVLMADNRSYRYGDGLFETMKVVRKKIALEIYHFERFFSSLALMGFKIPALMTAEKLQEQILLLCEKNKCESLARVRLSVFRGNGGIFESLDDFQYSIECWPLNETINQLNENGLVIDIYPDARKSCDKFSNIKSASYLPYVMAARYAKENKLNECLVLNVHERIADATIANIFLLKDGKIVTPPLSEGCVNGVMRRYLLEKVKSSYWGLSAEEREISVNDLQEADELFLTNAVSGIRWVKSFRERGYSNLQTKEIYKEFIQTISV